MTMFLFLFGQNVHFLWSITLCIGDTATARQLLTKMILVLSKNAAKSYVNCNFYYCLLHFIHIYIYINDINTCSPEKIMQFNKKSIFLLKTLIKFEKILFFYNINWTDEKSLFAVINRTTVISKSEVRFWIFTC